MGFLVIQYQPSLHSNFQASKVIQWVSKQNYFNNINYKPCSNFSPHAVPLSALSVSYLCSENTNGHVKLVPWSLCGSSRATALHCCNSFVCVVAPRPPMEWGGGGGLGSEGRLHIQREWIIEFSGGPWGDRWTHKRNTEGSKEMGRPFLAGKRGE